MRARQILTVVVVVLLLALAGWYVYRETNPHTPTFEEQLASAETEGRAARDKAIQSGLLLDKVKLYERYTRITNPTLEERAKAQELLEQIAKERPDLVEIKPPKRK
jgi:hypothetical protein